MHAGIAGVAKANTFSGKALVFHCCSTVLLEYFEY